MILQNNDVPGLRLEPEIDYDAHSIVHVLMGTRALIFHGLEATPESNWFSWLKNTLEAKRISTSVPQLPQTDRPEYEDWKETAVREIRKTSDKVIVFGHSLGGTLLLRLLQDVPEIESQIIQAYAIAPPFTDLEWPSLRKFFSENTDFHDIQARNITCLFSEDDPFVPVPNIKDLPIWAITYVFQDMGHFQHKEFPLLLEIIGHNI